MPCQEDDRIRHGRGGGRGERLIRGRCIPYLRCWPNEEFGPNILGWSDTTSWSRTTVRYRPARCPFEPLTPSPWSDSALPLARLCFSFRVLFFGAGGCLGNPAARSHRMPSNRLSRSAI